MNQRASRFFTDEKIVAWVIILNAIVLFFMSFDELHTHSDMFSVLDSFFVLFFALEAYFKIKELGWRKYFADAWNWMDFIIVILGIPSVLALFGVPIPDLSFMFALRLARLARFVKFITFIPNIRTLVAGIGRAFKASLFVFVAFFVLIFVISIVSCRMFKDASPEYFGNPLIAAYSIFKIFTVEGWYEIPDTLAEATKSPITASLIKLYFVIVVLCGGIFGLSIVNAIFVDEMVSDNNDDLHERLDGIEEKLNRLLEDKES